MKAINLYIIIILSILSFSSCKNSGTKNSKLSETLETTSDGKIIITEKIMYDVPVVNEAIGEFRSKDNPDWFWANLPSPEGDKFIQSLLEDAKSGRLKTYYFDMMDDYEVLEEIPENELKSFMSNVLNYKFEVVDTLFDPIKIREVEFPLTYKNIKTLRFLEEWYIYEGRFCKNVIAVAPFFTIEHPELSDPFETIFFWIKLQP